MFRKSRTSRFASTSLRRQIAGAKELTHHSRGGFRVTMLENGLKVISINDASPMTGLGVFSKMGTRYESESNVGSTTMMETLHLKGNQLFPQPEFAAKLAALGASTRSTSIREVYGWMINVPRYELQAGIDALHGIALHPTRDPAVFEDAKRTATERLHLVSRDATRCCFELVHQAAYGGVALGRPLAPTAEELEKLTHENFLKFHAAFVRPEDSVVVGVGISNHDEFVERLHNTLVFPDATFGVEARAKVEEDKGYLGGVRMQHNVAAPDTVKKFEEKNLSHMCLCFRGVPMTDPDYYIYSVIQTLLGGGMSFSSGGPGKGMHTKLFREVINKRGWIHGIEAVTAWYSHSGLVGLYGQVEHQYIPNLAEEMAHQAGTIAMRIDERHLQMAVNQLLSQLVLLGEGRDLRVEEIGKNLLLNNYVQLTDDLLAGAEKVTLPDLKRVCAQLVESPASYAVYGNTEKLPDLDTLVTRMKAYHRRGV